MSDPIDKAIEVTNELLLISEGLDRLRAEIAELEDVEDENRTPAEWARIKLLRYRVESMAARTHDAASTTKTVLQRAAALLEKPCPSTKS